MSGKNQIQVGIKVRPLLYPREKDLAWRVVDNSIQLLDTQSEYYFDHIFDQDATNQIVFDKMAKQIVKSAVEGFNGTIFAYGQTSSGKTYTMMGDQENPGVMVLTVKEIFKQISNHAERKFLLRVGYIEIYNEKINDLLNKANQDLKIHETNMGMISVNCEEVIVTSEDNMLTYLEQGGKERTVGETNMNERSSRSHAIFRIIIESRKIEPGGEDCITQSILNLVDLAGSERADQTKARGARLKEGGHINKSLLFLSNVIKRLSENEDDKYISYRDSKLTRILQASLGGNALTAIICTIKPNAIEETQSTLSFAMRAKTIKNKPQLNEIVSDATMMKRLEKEIESLKSKLAEEKHKNESKSKVGELEQRIKNELLKIISCNSLETLRKKKEKRRRTWASSDTMDDGNVPLASGIPRLAQLPPCRKNKISLSEFQSLESSNTFYCNTPLITSRTQQKRDSVSLASHVEEEHREELDNDLNMEENSETTETVNVEKDIHISPQSTDKTIVNTMSPMSYMDPKTALEIAERNLDELQIFTNLEQSNDVMHDVNSALQQKVDCLEQRNAELEIEHLNYVQIKIEFDELIESNKYYTRAHEESENRCSELQMKICELTEMNDTTEKKIKFYESELWELKKRCENLEMENRNFINLDFQYELLQNKTKVRETELLDRIADKDLEIEKLENTLKSLRKHNEEQLEELSSTQSLTLSSQQLQETLYQEIQELKLKLSEVAQKEEQQQQQLWEMENVKSTNKAEDLNEPTPNESRYKELVTQFDELQKEYDDLSNQLMDNLQDNENLKKENLKLTEYIQSFQLGEDPLDIKLEKSHSISANFNESEQTRESLNMSSTLKQFVQVSEFFRQIELILANGSSNIYKLINDNNTVLTDMNLKLRINLYANETDFHLKLTPSKASEEILNDTNSVNANAIMNNLLPEGILKTVINVVKLKQEEEEEVLNTDYNENNHAIELQYQQQQEQIIQLKEQLDREKCTNKLLLENAERNIAEMKEQINRLTAELLEKSLVVENCSCDSYQKEIALIKSAKANTTSITFSKPVNSSVCDINSENITKSNNSNNNNNSHKLSESFILREHEMQSTIENQNNMVENLTYRLLDLEAQLEACQSQLQNTDRKQRDLCSELQYEKELNRKLNEQFKESKEEWNRSNECYESNISEMRRSFELEKQVNLTCNDSCKKIQDEWNTNEKCFETRDSSESEKQQSLKCNEYLKECKEEWNMSKECYENRLAVMRENLEFEKQENLKFNEYLKECKEEWNKCKETYENNLAELKETLDREKEIYLKLNNIYRISQEEWNKSKEFYEDSVKDLKLQLENVKEKLSQKENEHAVDAVSQQFHEDFINLQEINRALQNELSNHQNECTKLTNDLKELRSCECALKNKNKCLQQDIEILQKAAQQMEMDNKNLQFDMEQLEKKYQDEGKKLVNNIKELEECGNMLRKNNERLQDDFVVSQKEMQQILEENRKLKIDAAELDKKYQEEHKNLANDIKELKECENMLKQQNQRLQDDSAISQKQMQQILEEKKKLEINIKELESKHQEELERLTNCIKELKECENMLKQENKRLQSDVEISRKQVPQILEEKKKLEIDIRELESKNQEECERLTNCIKELKEGENMLKQQNKQLQDDIAISQKQIQQMAEENQKLREELENECQEKCKIFANEIDKLKECENTLRQENKQFQDDIAKSQMQIQQILEEKKKLQSVMEELEKTVKAAGVNQISNSNNLEQKLKSLIEENRCLEAEKTKLLDNIERLEGQFSCATIQIRDLENRIKQLTNEYEQYKAEYSQLKNKLKDADNQIIQLCKEDQTREDLIRNLEMEIKDYKSIIEQESVEKNQLYQQQIQLFTEKESNLKDLQQWKEKCEKFNDNIMEKDKIINELKYAIDNHKMQNETYEKTLKELKCTQKSNEVEITNLSKQLQEQQRLSEKKSDALEAQELQSELELLKMENVNLKKIVEENLQNKLEREENLKILNQKLHTTQEKLDCINSKFSSYDKLLRDHDELKAISTTTQHELKITQLKLNEGNADVLKQSLVQYYVDGENNANRKLKQVESDLQNLKCASVQSVKHNELQHSDTDKLLKDQHHENKSCSMQQKCSNERRLRRLSTHDERRRQSFYLTNDKETMTTPIDSNCQCVELDEKLQECRQQLLIRDSQVTWLNMQLKNHPLKEENATLLKRLHEEQCEMTRIMQQLNEEMTKSQKALSAYSKIKELLNKTKQNEEQQHQQEQSGNSSDHMVPKILADAVSQTHGELNEEFHRLQLKNNDLQKLCRYRYKTILNLEEQIKQIGGQKENHDVANAEDPLPPLQAAQFSILKDSYDALSNELKMVKEKYEKAKVALQERRNEIRELRGQLDRLTTTTTTTVPTSNDENDKNLLMNNYDTLTNELHVIKEKYEKAKVALQARRNEIRQLRAQMETLTIKTTIAS